jgi:hypothetical protein
MGERRRADVALVVARLGGGACELWFCPHVPISSQPTCRPAGLSVGSSPAKGATSGVATQLSSGPVGRKDLLGACCKRPLMRGCSMLRALDHCVSRTGSGSSEPSQPAAEPLARSHPPALRFWAPSKSSRSSGAVRARQVLRCSTAGGFAGPGESTISRLTGQDGAPLMAGVQERRRVSATVVRTLLARSHSSTGPTAGGSRHLSLV